MCMFIWVRVCKCVCACVTFCVCVCVFSLEYLNMHAYIFACVCVCMCVFVYVCENSYAKHCVCIYACIYVCVGIWVNASNDIDAKMFELEVRKAQICERLYMRISHAWSDLECCIRERQWTKFTDGEFIRTVGHENKWHGVLHGYSAASSLKFSIVHLEIPQEQKIRVWKGIVEQVVGKSH